MKPRYYILLALLVLVTQSKKCSNYKPPTIEPPPSSTTTTKTVYLPLDNGKTTGGSGSQLTYKYPNMGGGSNFPPYCTFTTSHVAAIRIYVKYYVNGANGLPNEETYSDKMYSNSDVYDQIGIGSPMLDIEVPDSGYYFLEIEYMFQNCSKCCGRLLAQNTGVAGCDPVPETNNEYQGKPKIKGKTEFKDWNGYLTIGNVYVWNMYDFLCICNCL